LGLVDKASLPSLKHTGAVNSKFKSYLAMNKLKKAALAHIATHLSHDEVKGLEDIFKAIDVDGDGTLTIDELKGALTSNSFSTEVQVEIHSMIDTLQVEGTLELNWREFCAATVDKSMLMQEDKIRMAFNYFDRTHRGSISVRDLSTVFGSDTQAQEIMGEIDANGDGLISYEEFHEMMEGKSV